MKKFNNKGAALISVMIAITFLSIVSTTLLVITLNNYQMKVVNSQSKSNFYETEQRINVVTAQVRNSFVGATDVNGSIGSIVNGGTGVDYSGTSFAYTADAVAKLAFPGETPAAVGTNSKVVYDGDEFYFYPGTVTVTQKTNGKQVTMEDVTIKQVAKDSKGGYENTIKTDINFFVEIATGGGASGGVGSCAFLLDNKIRIDASDKITRLNITGNTIMGEYKFVNNGSYTTSFKGGSESTETLTKYSVLASLSKTRDASNEVTKVTLDESNYQKAIIYLNSTSFMNFNSDNNIILGDIYLKDMSVLNILDGSITVYGDIFVADKAAFICNGKLKLGYNSGIYKVDGYGNCTKVTASDKSKNIFYTSFQQLDKKNYDKLADHLNLFDEVSTNDGVFVNIIQKHPVVNKYFYQAANAYQTKSNKLCTFNGIDYYATYPATSLNYDFANELIFFNDDVSDQYKIVANVPNSTLISRKSIYAYDTNNICVSKMGDQAFNYILSHDECKINFQPNGGNPTSVSINGFFNPNCNNFVTTVFSLGSGNTGSTPAVTKTKVSFSDWKKE